MKYILKFTEHVNIFFMKVITKLKKYIEQGNNIYRHVISIKPMWK